MTVVRPRTDFSQVGVGLAVFGATSYAFLAVAARACQPGRFSALSLLWIVTTTVGAGLFLPVEQELARSLAHYRSRHEPAGEATAVAIRAALLGLAGVTVSGLIAFAPLKALFDSQGAVVLAVLANFAGQALAYLARGVAAGTEHFGIYSAQLALEGTLRVGFASFLLFAGTHTAAPFGFALAAASLLSAVVAAPSGWVLLRSRTTRQVSPRPKLLSHNVAWLTAGALGSQALANSAPLLVKLRGTSSPAETAQFFATLLVARLPLFAFAAVQAVLLPALARALGSGDTAAFTRSLRRVEAAVLALGGAAVGGAAAFGVPLVHLVFGKDYALGRTELVLLGAGTVVYMAANVQAQAALALNRHRNVATAWVLGCGIGVVVSLTGENVRTLVAVSFAAGSAGALAVLATTVRRALHQEHAPSAATHTL